MATYEVLIEFEANQEKGVNTVTVEAESIEAGPEWIVFYSTGTPHAFQVVAAFPIKRVISVTSTQSHSNGA